MSDEATNDDPTLKTARDLKEILSLTQQLNLRAIDRANSRIMPGGHSTVALAHVSNREAWANRIDGSERWNDSEPVQVWGRQPRDLTHINDEDDSWEPPLQTLQFWSEMWRYQLGSETDLTPTIATETRFLEYALPWAVDHEPGWDQFVKDVRGARVRLENELYAGDRTERTKVPCMECDPAPTLIKVYADQAKYDHWKCTFCKETYDLDKFVRAKQQLLHSQGADRFVKIQDAIAAIDRSNETVRKWVTGDKVEHYRDKTTRQLYVWWPDVRNMDLNTPRRKRTA